MKKTLIFIAILLGFVTVSGNLLASHDKSGADSVIREEMQAESGMTEVVYKTWTVIDVTDDTIILQKKRRNGKINEVILDRSRRPSLKVGDRVRYDNARNRLRKTVTK